MKKLNFVHVLVVAVKLCCLAALLSIAACGAAPESPRASWTKGAMDELSNIAQAGRGRSAKTLCRLYLVVGTSSLLIF